MNNMHLPSSSRSMATAWNFPLGIEDFRYADLNRVRRLMALDRAFRAELRATSPALAERYEQSCDQHERGAGKEDTQLLIDVARHLDAFIHRAPLSHRQEVAELNRRTSDDGRVCDFKKRFLAMRSGLSLRFQRRLSRHSRYGQKVRQKGWGVLD